MHGLCLFYCGVLWRVTRSSDGQLWLAGSWRVEEHSLCSAVQGSVHVACMRHGSTVVLSTSAQHRTFHCVAAVSQESFVQLH